MHILPHVFQWQIRLSRSQMSVVLDCLGCTIEATLETKPMDCIESQWIALFCKLLD